ncbi:hypothetical protein KOI35_43400 [Actinoplanes bogorensis]|uniref:Uncharacterized protein n=1 Tax=Paractinoplanes bogorensis TaxID=1610840 RepID=A0ABS5Z3V8_9ACTN|nr:hypothetical protein [Actinoplanes bogorensis]MBU2670370.1 hypothetical protein [Actinoplanes bogorensis]
MTLEEDLRTTLHDRAARPPSQPDPDLWEKVVDGVWRRRRRHRAVAMGGAALALVAVATVPPLLAHRSAPPPPQPAVSPPPRVQQPDFPLRPDWVPPSAGTPTVTQLGPNSHLSYERGTSVLNAEIGPLEPDWEVEATDEHTTTVNGRSALVHAADTYDGATPGDRFVGVRWRLSDGRRVQVLSLGNRTEADVLRFARGLTPGTVPAAPSPFTFASVPPGLTLQHQSAGFVCLAPPSIVAESRQPTGLCIGVTSEPDNRGSAPDTVTVNGRLAAYYSDSAALDVDLGYGRTLQLTWDDSGPTAMTREEALHFAAGITVRS